MNLCSAITQIATETVFIQNTNPFPNYVLSNENEGRLNDFSEKLFRNPHAFQDRFQICRDFDESK